MPEGLAASLGVDDDMIQRVEQEKSRIAKLRDLPSSNLLVVCTFGLVFSALLGGMLGLMFGGIIGFVASQFGFQVLPIAIGSSVVCAVWGSLIMLKEELSKSSRRQAAMNANPYATYEEITRVERFELAARSQSEASWVRWCEMDGLVFEREFAKLLRNHGWSVRATKGSGDGGIDIEGTDSTGVHVAIQCKWWKSACGVAPVRELVGATAVMPRRPRMIVVCDGGFTESAKEFARKTGVELMDGRAVRSMVESLQAGIAPPNAWTPDRASMNLRIKPGEDPSPTESDRLKTNLPCSRVTADLNGPQSNQPGTHTITDPKPTLIEFGLDEEVVARVVKFRKSMLDGTYEKSCKEPIAMVSAIVAASLAVPFFAMGGARWGCGSFAVLWGIAYFGLRPSNNSTTAGGQNKASTRPLASVEEIARFETYERALGHWTRTSR